MDYASVSSVRPDRALTVKCAFERSTRRIHFTSARNCSIGLLKSKVEEGFSLSAGSFTIAYKDDDGEIIDIVTDADLTEAVLYFQSGVDDVPISSAASFYSARSSGSRKITLRVQVQVDYDGPSLSDTSSLISPEDRNLDLDDLEFGDEISLGDGYDPQVEPEDDSITISSRDTGQRVYSVARRSKTSSETLLPKHSTPHRTIYQPAPKLTPSAKTVVPPKSAQRGRPLVTTTRARSPLSKDCSDDIQDHSNSPASSEFSAAARYPADPSAVFERLKFLEQTTEEASSPRGDMPPQTQIDRGKQWLLEQSSRTPLAPIIGPPSDAESSIMEDHIEEDLALQRNSSGRYYYIYKGGSSTASQSQDASSDYQERSQGDEDPSEREALLSNGHGYPSNHLARTLSDPFPSSAPDVPDELLPFIETLTPPDHIITDCSSCGRMLDSFRYICTVCGEKRPYHQPDKNDGKGKAMQMHLHTYPPNGHADYSSSSSGSPLSKDKPLPGIPSPASTALLSAFRSRNPSSDSLGAKEGYELCSSCIQFMGVIHAVEGDMAPSEGAHSPESNNALSAMRRSAPKRRGFLRHAYREKMWAGTSWTDVEQDLQERCSICSSSLALDAYKCTSCDKFELCRACYSQVHEIHPSHAFLIARDSTSLSSLAPPSSPRRSVSESDAATSHVDSMVHVGVTCTHCMLEIVGARFHCAICDSIDICANCESAGLPGNLTADDGGHDSSHIMIKIPFPLESSEVKNKSRRAVHLWTDRDAPKLTNGGMIGRRRSDSVESDRARTIIGRGARTDSGVPASHGIDCRVCGKNIVGVRYQCATCPSHPNCYSLCADCEPLSYVHHDPMHFFLKVVRPVDRPIESPFGLLPSIYRTPAGTKPDGTRNLEDPQEYIKSLYHHTSLCDVCMERIRGEWYRCVYCAKDLCRDHEAMDTHDATHLFIVFKSAVDMAQFRNFADLENASRSPPLIPYAVYTS